MKKFIYFFSVAIILIPASGIASTLTGCTELASKMNEQLPMKVDKVTTWKSSVCARTDKGVTLAYLYILDVTKGQVSQTDLNTLRASQLNSWCTNPEQRALINIVDIEYQYYDKNSAYIGVLKYKRSMC